jgi:4-hydroxybenzoate polyprenyltransferase
MIRYWIERFPLQLFGPVAALIVVAAHPSGQTIGRWVADIAIVTLLLAQFRLWDDLADRRHDRQAHPERVLARAERLGPFVALCLALSLINLTIAWRAHSTAALVLLALNVTTAAWYALRSEPRSVSGDLVVLAKYPLFVLIVAMGSAGVQPPALLMSMMASSLVALTYEAWHDPVGPLAGTLRGVRSHLTRVRTRGADA